HLPWILAVAAAGLLIAYLALFPAVFALLLAFALRRLGHVALLLAPAIWVATELGRTYFLTGFPWVLLGYAESPILPIAQMVSLFCIFGLSAFVAPPAAVAAYAFFESNRRRLIITTASLMAMMIVLIGWGEVRVRRSELLTQGDPIRVAIVQGSVPQEDKWQ